jgi:hypothetical protein
MSLFELMRNGVVTGLYKFDAPNMRQAWTCNTSVPIPRTGKSFGAPGFEVRAHHDSTALGAFMKARTYILARVLKGEPIYTITAQKAREKLGL